MKRLIMISGSARIKKEPREPIPAIQRMDGLAIRLVRKYNQNMNKIDIVIVSPIYGFVKSNTKISYQEPLRGNWREFSLDYEHILLLNKSWNHFKRQLDKKRYEEIYINIGQPLIAVLDGFKEKLPKNAKIIYSEGRGIGPKMAHMKRWLESQSK